MYTNVRGQVLVGQGYSQEFEVKVSVSPVLSPLLFIVLEFPGRTYMQVVSSSLLSRGS